MFYYLQYNADKFIYWYQLPCWPCVLQYNADQILPEFGISTNSPVCVVFYYLQYNADKFLPEFGIGINSSVGLVFYYLQ